MRGPASAVLRLAWTSVRRRPLPSILTGLSVALAIALVIAVDTLRTSTERSYADAARGYDVVLGPPAGSPLQTVLATLFHVDVPYGTLSWEVYEDALRDPRVASAVPYAIGDTFRGHRVVGTTPTMFEVLDDGEGRPLGEDVAGRMFGEEGFEAVVGSLVARAAGLRVGSTFRVTHGLGERGAEHGDTWEVVGVLRPTGTP
ncbi:MAG: ABC transporter permease, partial [Planctomycetota bacterium]